MFGIGIVCVWVEKKGYLLSGFVASAWSTNATPVYTLSI